MHANMKTSTSHTVSSERIPVAYWLVKKRVAEQEEEEHQEQQDQ